MLNLLVRFLQFILGNVTFYTFFDRKLQSKTKMFFVFKFMWLNARNQIPTYLFFISFWSSIRIIYYMIFKCKSFNWFSILQTLNFTLHLQCVLCAASFSICFFPSSLLPCFPYLKDNIMAKYVPFLSPIRLLVNLHKGL